MHLFYKLHWTAKTAHTGDMIPASTAQKIAANWDKTTKTIGAAPNAQYVMVDKIYKSSYMQAQDYALYSQVEKTILCDKKVLYAKLTKS